MKTLSPAQKEALYDLKRMSRREGFVWAADCRHLDGRTLRGLWQRGLVQYRDFRYYVKHD